jgi:hypothetical protein
MAEKQRRSRKDWGRITENQGKYREQTYKRS